MMFKPRQSGFRVEALITNRERKQVRGIWQLLNVIINVKSPPLPFSFSVSEEGPRFTPFTSVTDTAQCLAHKEGCAQVALLGLAVHLSSQLPLCNVTSVAGN